MREYLVLREAWVQAETPQQAAEAAIEDFKRELSACCVVIDPARRRQAVAELLNIANGNGVDEIYIAQ